jgi:uncharacterized protein (TIGR00255 family)
VTAEARSVNNRGLDVKVKAPAELNPWESDVRRMVREACSRGSIQVTLSVEHPAGGRARIDMAAARRLKADLLRLQRELSLPGTVDLDMVTRFPAALAAPERGPEGEALWAVATRAAGKALAALVASRRREGKAIGRDLDAHHRVLSGLVGGIRRGTPRAFGDLRKAIVRRVRDLSDPKSLDRRRLEEEAALLASRRDFTEELNRLAAHLDEFGKVTRQAGPIGRNLEFLAQEILRELTTIASKAPGTDIVRLTVDARVEVEKIREQVYNVQ